MALTSQALDRFGDIKLVESYNQCISNLATSIGPRFVSQLIVKNIADSNKPKVISECCGTLSRLISEYGTHVVPLSDIVNFGKHCISQANQIIKKAGTNLLVNIYSYTGKALLSQLSDVKEATRKVLDEEF